jgi:hypothetical protein
MTYKSTKEEFIHAVHSDSYAEYKLSTGDILITDWESDGSYNPHVIERDQDDSEDRADDIASAIQSEFDSDYCNVEKHSSGGDIYMVHTNKPDIPS